MVLALLSRVLFLGHQVQRKLAMLVHIATLSSGPHKYLYLITSLWYISNAQTKEDFDTMLAMADNQGVINAVSNVDEKTESNQTELNLEDK